MFSQRVFFLPLIIVLFVSVFSLTAQGSKELEFQLFRDEVSLTVYVPAGAMGSLANVSLMVSSNGGERGYALDDPILLAFDGFVFNQIHGPICFRLEKTGSPLPPPIECSNLDASQKLTQQLSASNIFWYDDAAKTGLLVIIKRGSEVLGQCPGMQSNCTIHVPQNILFDSFNGSMLKSHWRVDNFPSEFYRLEDGHLHITATNNTGRWAQWDMALELDGTYVSAEADFELIMAQGGETFIGIGGTTLDNEGCFAVGLWANDLRYPNEQRGYTEVGGTSADSSTTCQNVESSIYNSFEWTNPTRLAVDLSSSALQLLKNGSPVKSSALGTGSTFFLRIQLDPGATLEGYVDNVTVKYSGSPILSAETSTLTEPLTPVGTSLMIRCFENDATCTEAKPILGNGSIGIAGINFPNGHLKITGCGNAGEHACGWWTWLDRNYDYNDCEVLAFDAYVENPPAEIQLLIEFKLGAGIKIYTTELELEESDTWIPYRIDYNFKDNPISEVTLLIQKNQLKRAVHFDNIRFENCFF